MPIEASIAWARMVAGWVNMRVRGEGGEGKGKDWGWGWG